MYNEVVTTIRPLKFILYYYRLTSRIKIKSYLFAQAMDKLTRYIQDDMLWYMLFVNDIVLIEESR